MITGQEDRDIKLPSQNKRNVGQGAKHIDLAAVDAVVILHFDCDDRAHLLKGGFPYADV
jgi:hypothetical protein